MRAYRLHTPGQIEFCPLQLEELPVPIPHGREILIEVICCGLCRTDLHVIEGDLPTKKLPLTPGHQVVGIVVGRGSQAREFSVGDRAGVAWLRSTCTNCSYCVSGNENLCESSRYTGYHEDGGYAEYAVVDESYAYHIPASIDPQLAAPLLCAGIIGYRALKRSALPAQGRLGLFGFGSSAHIVLQLARARGSQVFVATRGEEHRAFARTLGATWVGDSFGQFPEKVDSAIVFAPAGEIVPAALRAVRKAGTVALAGIHMSTIPALSYEEHLFHEKHLCSVEANTRKDGEELFREIVALGIVPHVVSFPFSEAPQALLRLKNDGIRGTAVLAMKHSHPSK